MISLEPPRSIPEDTDPWGEFGLNRAGLTRFLSRVQGLAGLRGEVDVLLAGDRTLRRLNRQFRGKNKATDVLSFPAPPELGDGHAGDLAISLETADRQAAEHGLRLRDEVRILLLHGVLHLAGFDHEIDEGEMAAEEAQLRRRLRLPVGLIARVTAGEVKPGARKPAAAADRQAASRRAGGATRVIAGRVRVKRAGAKQIHPKPADRTPVRSKQPGVKQAGHSVAGQQKAGRGRAAQGPGRAVRKGAV